VITDPSQDTPDCAEGGSRARPQQRKFLGFSFTDGPESKRTIAPKALERFKHRIREVTLRAKGVSLETTIAELASYLRGWRSYFGVCETPHVLIQLTRWVRLRLRAARWRQWKTPRRRQAALLELRGSPATGQQHGWQRTWPLVSGPGQSPLCGAFPCSLQIARTSHVDRWMLA
jgi:hypothetical protein